MAGDMNVPDFVMGCHKPGDEAAARALTVRALWAYDAGICCGNHLDPKWSAIALEHSPSCIGCVRKLRAELIRDGKLEPHPRTITNPQRKAAA